MGCSIRPPPPGLGSRRSCACELNSPTHEDILIPLCYLNSQTWKYRPGDELLYTSAQFSGSGYFLLSGRRLKFAHYPFIHVYRYTRHGVEFLAEFGLPALYTEEGGEIAMTWYNHYSAVDESQNVDFRPSRSVLMHLQLTHSLRLFAPSSALLTPEVTSHPLNAEPLHFPWDTWGPRSTRIVEKVEMDVIISGYRVIFPDDSEIWDFAPRQFVLSSGAGQEDVVDWPEVLPANNERVEEITTWLPYRRIKCSFPQIFQGTTLSDVVETGTAIHVRHLLN